MWKGIVQWWSDTDNIGCAIMGILCIIFVVFGCWLVWLVLSGIYHLIDKLIDKL